jgi:single-stranded DNA-binding protein
MILRQGGSTTIVGNLTRNPERPVSKTTGKQGPAKCAIAVGKGDDVRFINIIAWYEQGDILMDARKGDKVRVFGVEEKSTFYSEKQGADVEKMEVNCEWVDVRQRTHRAETNDNPAPPPEMQETDLDMPF